MQSILLSIATSHFTGIQTLAEDLANKSCGDLVVTDQVFFDIAIDKNPVGRLVVGLFGEDVPIGAKRFAEIAVGNRGISYRKKEFTKITSSYIQNAGVRNFSISGGIADAANFTGGETAEALIPELEERNQKCSGIKNVAGTVSIVVKDIAKPPPKTKLIAKDGKFEVLEEEFRPDPNGTEFTIATTDSPQLDATNLVVGKVIDGTDVLQAIRSVKVVQENSSSPYFRAAKLIGDTRAVVAERGFNRPYSKITIIQSGRVSG